MTSDISVSLTGDKDVLWKSCFEMDHEMMITVPGRRMFPLLEYEVKGLDPLKIYSMSAHFELVDEMKYRFVGGNWTQSPSTEEKGDPRIVFHRNGPQLGQNWMDQPLSFDQIRITNRKSNERINGPSFVHLFTQHRYIPVLTIYEGDQIVHISKIDYTSFITVTAYHGNGLNQFKTNTNPYATGSRQDRRQKREAESSSLSAKRMRKVSEPSTSYSPVPIFPFLPMLPCILPQQHFLRQYQFLSLMGIPLQQQPMDMNQFFSTLHITPPITPEASTQVESCPVRDEQVEPTIDI
ncbi:hypothetical protein GCK72_000985 [Caenorhabditis remanei]|uniref:T-box domain-containing protein n=1 Tax=Caenorhabditis remanei TaxID=31234 RepID=A0A6A5HPL6_CAERE|nr:hypothetical protein GCK72_000985 [Caenorhabditis remanei]KAF1769171.1 hypothetical protein GCK72_000985 [Caenorhabditis remanei]